MNPETLQSVTATAAATTNGGIDTMATDWNDMAIGQALCDLHKDIGEVKYDLGMQTKDAKLLMKDCVSDLKGDIAASKSEVMNAFNAYALQEQRDRAQRAETENMFRKFFRGNPSYHAPSFGHGCHGDNFPG